MKKTHIIELLSNVKSTFKSFFSIMMFVALSVGIFVGISWVAPAIQDAADQMFKEGNLCDFEVQYPNGFTQEDLDELETLDGVDTLEEGYVAYQMVKHRDSEYVFKVLSLTEEINVVSVESGKLPQELGEIALDITWAKNHGVKVGDNIVFTHDEETYLNADEFKVTALVKSPSYISKKDMSYGVSALGSGFVQCIAYVDTKSFDTSAFLGYPQVYICSNELYEEKGFGKGYAAVSAELHKAISTLSDEKSAERYNALREEGQKRINEGEAELAEAKAKIEDGESQIAEARRKVEEGKAAISNGERELSEGYNSLLDGEEQYDEAVIQYDEAAALLDNLKDARAAYENDKTEENLLALHDAYDELRSYVLEEWDFDLDIYSGNDINTTEGFILNVDEIFADEQGVMDYAKTELESKKQQLNDGWKAYYKGIHDLEVARADLIDAQNLLYQKTAELEDGKLKYKKGKAELKEQKELLGQLKKYEWNIAARSDNGGVLRIERFSDLTGNLRFSMAALFVLIGLLVSYSAVSRIVQDQRQLLGTKKALGMHSKEITFSYLAYSGGAVILGSIIGLILGTRVVEALLVKIVGANYIISEYVLHFNILEAIILVAFELAAILAATWMACKNVLSQQAVLLLKGAEPPSAKQRFFEKWSLWKSLPLFTKTVVNNCFNDKRRVFATIIGIAGCTALIVTAVTINDNLRKSFDRQYDNVYSYDTIVRFDSDKEEDKNAIEDELKKTGASGTIVHRSSYKLILPDGSTNAATITIPFDDSQFGEFYSCNDKGREQREYEDGAWINLAYGKHMDAEVGDKMTVTDSEGQSYEITIEGFFEHYLLSYQMIMDRDAFEKVFDEECTANAFLVDSNDKGAEAIEKQLLGFSFIRGVDDDYGTSFDVFNEFFQIARSVIILYLVLSVLMAIVVLYDLYAVFIEEKKRELIIMMINGYAVKAAKQYIYRDTVVLTVIGIILGIILGSLMGNLTIISIEPDEGFFVKGIDWIASGVGAVVSSILAIVLCSFAMRRIKKFKLTDINRI